MPRRLRRKSSSFDELFAQERERVLEQQARAIAGQEGRPPYSRRPNEALERAAWDDTDPAVTAQHFAEIAMQTVQELSQERDEQGQPRWNADQIEAETKLRQSLALHPYRALTFESGVAAEDFETKAELAERAAKRFGAPMLPAPSDAGGWSEPIDEDAKLGERY